MGASFAVFFGVYFVMYGFLHSTWNKERIYRKLIAAGREEQLVAARDLIYYKAQKQLIRALKSESPATRELALNSLWDFWYRLAGEKAFHLIQTSQTAIEKKDFLLALETLNRLVKQYPKFAEGWNRRATLFWLLGQYDLSIADCQIVLALNPEHFGAWQGLGLCQFHRGEYGKACRSLRRAVRLNPHDESVQKLLKQCEEMLRRFPPQLEIQGNLV